MVTTVNPNSDIDLISCLVGQNLYQRLGLKTNDVSDQQVRTAFEARMLLLRECAASLKPEEYEHAEKLIVSAYVALASQRDRIFYDRKLQRENVWKGRAKKRDFGSKKTIQGLGALMGRYSLGATIHDGPRATVREARDCRLNRQVVVKQLRPQLIESESIRRAIARQAETCATYESANVVKILDVDENAGAVVMEKMQCDLQSLLGNYGIDEAVAVNILRDCLAGLGCLHSKGTLHGRIDPSHILLDNRGAAKLLITPHIADGRPALGAGFVPRHSPPELANSRVFGAMSMPSDIYALGFTVLELLAGVRFGETIGVSSGKRTSAFENWQSWHASPAEHLPSISSLLPGISTSLAEILERMTSKHPYQRFSNSMECLNQLNSSIPEESSRMSNWTRVHSEIVGSAAFVASAADEGDSNGLYQTHSAEMAPETSQYPTASHRAERRKFLGLFVVGCIAVATLLILGIRYQGDASQVGVRPSNSTSNLEEVGLSEPVNIPQETFELAQQTQQTEELLDALESTVDASTSEAGITIQDQDQDQDQDGGKLVDSERCKIYFQVKPAGYILEIVDSNGAQLLESLTPAGERFWELAAGTYTVTYCAEDGDFKNSSRVTVPQNVGSMHWILNISDLPYSPFMGMKRVDSQSSESKAKISRSSTSYPVFSLQGVNSLNRSELNRRLRQRFESFSSGNEEQLVSINALREYSKSTNLRDPRISFYYALEAYRRNDIPLAKEFAARSIREAKTFKVPFILPVKLLCHLELQHAHLAHASNACRDAIRWMGGLQHQRDDELFKLAFDDLVEWTGTVIGFIELTRHERLREHVNTRVTIDAIERHASERQRQLYTEAYKGLESNYRNFLASHSARLAAEENYEQWKDDEFDIRRESQREKVERQRTGVCNYPYSRSRIEVFGAPSPSYYAKDRDNTLKIETSSDSWIGIRETLGPKPPRPPHYLSTTRPQEFRSYQPFDLMAMADEACLTLPTENDRVETVEKFVAASQVMACR